MCLEEELMCQCVNICDYSGYFLRKWIMKPDRKVSNVDRVRRQKGEEGALVEFLQFHGWHREDNIIRPKRTIWVVRLGR